jgi:DNA-binding Lrp family transcriptional regulator
VKAFLLIQTLPDSRAIAADLRAIPGIEWADDLTGAFDAIARVCADSMRALSESILTRIRELPGVTRVLPAPLVTSVPAALRESAAAA